MVRPKPAVIIVSIIVLALLLSIVYVLFVPRDKIAAPSKPARQAQPTDTSPDQAKPRVAQGSYVDYSDNIIASTPGEKLLFFHASWCPQCRAIEADIKDGGIPDNTTIIKVDYDSSQSLRQKYKVTLQTTFVKIDGQGNEIKKFVAYDEPTLAAAIKGTR